MTMMFEVADLAVASPATVSRCGMVYLEPGYIGLEPFVSCWLNNCPPGVNREELKSLFDKYMEPAIDWMRRNVKEIVGSVNGNLGTFQIEPALKWAYFESELILKRTKFFRF